MILNPQHIHHVWKKAANQVTRNLYLQISVRHYQTTSRFIAGGGITMLIKQMSTVLNTFQAAYKNKASFFPKEQSPISDCLQHTHTQSFIYTFSLITWWFPSNARPSLSPHCHCLSRSSNLIPLDYILGAQSVFGQGVDPCLKKFSMTLEVSGHVCVCVCVSLLLSTVPNSRWIHQPLFSLHRHLWCHCKHKLCPQMKDQPGFVPLWGQTNSKYGQGYDLDHGVGWTLWWQQENLI